MDPISEIQENAKHIDLLLCAAKCGNWNIVWQILGHPSRPHKAFLINCIPENRRWGVLHQAIWWNKKENVEKLLEFAACDINIKAKEGNSEIGPTGGKSALEIAEGFQRKDIVELLQKKVSQFKAQATKTFYHLSSEREDCTLSLLKITLAAYNKTFQPHGTGIKSKSFEDFLRDVWMNIDSVQGHWELVRDKVAESVYVVCQRTCNKIKACESKEKFYDLIIKIYTEEDNRMYDNLNTALRRQRQRQGDYIPTAADLALGPFVLMYQLLLLFWNELPRENCITYRKMNVTVKELQEYQVGIRFAWMSFVSSSANLASARRFPTWSPSGDKAIVFTIDNSSSSNWQPRNIEKYATFMERERCYPAGAKFVVTNKSENSEGTNISLRLLNNSLRNIDSSVKSSTNQSCMIM